MLVLMRIRNHIWPAVAGLLFCLCLASPAPAADYDWDNGGITIRWDDLSNWDPDAAAIPGVGDRVTFIGGATVDLSIAGVPDLITITNGANVTFTNNSLTTGALAVQVAGSTITMNTGGTLLDITGGFSHAALDIILAGPGNFYVQGTNTFTGSGTTTLSSGATLFFNGNQQINLPDAATGGGTRIGLSSNAMLNIYHTGAGLDYQGQITGTGSLSITGGGTVTLSGTNSYSGSTSIAGAGRLIATGAGNQLPAGTDLTVNAPATCEFDAQTVGSISGSGTIQINAGGALTVNEAGTGSFSGAITGPAGTFVLMSGTGTLTLSGALTAGAQVANAAGTLVFNGSTTQDMNLIAGTLLGTGTCNGILTIGAGTFGPGNSIGTFNAAGGFNMGAGTTLAIEVSGAAADQVNVTGAAIPNGADLSVTGGPTKGAAFTIVNNDGVDPIGGTFNGLAEGATFVNGGYQYEITYVGGDGNDVVLTALTGVTPGSPTPDPEPEPEPTGPDAPSVIQGSGPSPIGSLEGTPLTWPSVKGADHYRVYRADCPNCKRTAIGWVAETSFVDNTAVAGKPYYYWVRSENSDGMGPYSNWMAAWRYEQNPGRAGDFNGDGVMDLLWWNPNNNQLSIWFMNNGQVASVSAPGEALDINEWLLIATADFNGDGVCDLLWWNPENGEALAWYLDKTKFAEGGAGEWLIGSTVVLETMTSHAAMAYTGDFNGDGKADILWRDYSNGDVLLWLMGDDGKPQLTGPPTPADEGITRGERPGVSGTLNWQVAGLGDADGNGKVDVIWKDARNNRLAAWTMDASTISAVTQENKGLDVVWRSVGLGDLNGDGHADMVWRNEASGAVQAWLLQGGVFNEERSMLEGSEEAAQWQVKAVGDFCQPGRDDIYCKHSENGALRIVTLEGVEHYPNVE